MYICLCVGMYFPPPIVFNWSAAGSGGASRRAKPRLPERGFPAAALPLRAVRRGARRRQRAGAGRENYSPLSLSEDL